MHTRHVPFPIRALVDSRMGVGSEENECSRYTPHAAIVIVCPPQCGSMFAFVSSSSRMVVISAERKEEASERASLRFTWIATRKSRTDVVNEHWNTSIVPRQRALEDYRPNIWLVRFIGQRELLVLA